MNTMAFDKLLGCKLSVATNKNKPDGTPESYVGYLESIGNDFIILDYDKASSNRSNAIAKVILLAESIVGVWVYKE